MPASLALTREILLAIATTVLQARRARRWTQRRLASVSGLSQSTVSEIERGRVPDLPIATALQVLAALDVRVDLRLIAPTASAPPVRDRAHARCVAYVARQLQRSGWLVATEVEVGDRRWRGFIDVLAMHPSTRVLLVIEVKVDLDDVGAIDRQLGYYERDAWAAAHRLGWRPRAITSCLLLLATESNDRRLAEHRPYLDRRFRVRSSDLAATLADGYPPFARGERALAMIDPRTRRSRWVLPTWLDGRRRAARYADRAAYLAA